MFQTLITQPFYNLLVFFTNVFNGHVALAVILLTILIKVILYPLAKKAYKAQIAQRKLAPELEKIRKEFPDKQVQAQKTMELYKTTGSNPFSGCLPILIQLPIIIGIYQVFFKGIEAQLPLLYTSITAPTEVIYQFLGMNLQVKSIILALLAGITQYIQIHFSPAMQSTGPVDQSDNQAVMMASMNSSMKYTMPVVMTVIGFTLPGAIALYFVVTNIVTIIQEYIMRKTIVE
jgi:YidC/Oxa1 family membrane protein insertase